MALRPLRQYYDGVAVVVDDDLGSVVEPWSRQRRRLTAALSELTEAQWKSPTRCTSWDARGVVSHLITVDGFFTMTLRAAAAGDPPTTFIRSFDPSTGTDDLVAPLLELPTEALFEQFVTGTDTLLATVQTLEGDDWRSLGEAPFGHMPARLILAHAFWDSWLHERDVLVPLGVDVPVEDDELLTATWYTVLVGGLQGGLLDDSEPVGPGADAPIDATLQFDDLPIALRVQIDTGTRISRGDGAHAVRAGSAVRLVEGVAGRAPADAMTSVPADLAEQLGRAAQIL
jgi:uncharacterized protein (TIGR03083 family)